MIEHNKCDSCGAGIDRNMDSCPYCGTAYPRVISTSKVDVSSPVEIKETLTNKNIRDDDKDINPVLFFILLIFLPPIGIAYFILAVIIKRVRNAIKDISHDE